jgi:hypothetical protein
MAEANTKAYRHVLGIPEWNIPPAEMRKKGQEASTGIRVVLCAMSGSGLC